MGWLSNLSLLFRPEPPSAQLFLSLRGMLSKGQALFEAVTAPIFDADEPRPERELVYGLDKDLNKAEIETRRRLLTSIAVNPLHDIATRMLLLSAVKHVERCGDLTKNVFEVFERSGPLKPSAHRDFLWEQREFIRELFDQIWEVFDSGDSAAADRIRLAAKRFSEGDVALVHELLQASDCGQAVALAMLSRFFKRIMGHLVNIAKEVAEPEPG